MKDDVLPQNGVEGSLTVQQAPQAAAFNLTLRLIRQDTGFLRVISLTEVWRKCVTKSTVATQLLEWAYLVAEVLTATRNKSTSHAPEKRV